MPRMGEWSNECTARNLIRWSRGGRVLVADRGREFAFATEEGGVEGTIWRCRFEPADGGTR